jgi:hypothetical protein
LWHAADFGHGLGYLSHSLKSAAIKGKFLGVKSQIPCALSERNLVSAVVQELLIMVRLTPIFILQQNTTCTISSRRGSKRINLPVHPSKR